MNLIGLPNRWKMAGVISTAWLLLTIPAAVLFAQTEPTPEPSAPETPPAKVDAPKKPMESDAGQKLPGSANVDDKNEIVYVVGPNGQYIPLLKNVDVRQFLDWLNASSEPADKTPKYSITRISITGSAQGDDRLVCDATISIQLPETEQWVVVPLSMPEAVLLASSYEGDGKSIFGGRDRELGYRWWFRGAGSHTLKLSLSIPLSVTSPTRRIQLSLPSAAVSDLNATIPMPQVSVRGPDASAIKVSSTEDGRASIIQIFGLGRFLDLSWQPVPQRARTELQASTLISAKLIPNGAGFETTLECTQTIRATQGSFSEVTVRLPDGFEFIDVESKEMREFEFDAKNDKVVTVRFAQAVLGPVVLKWTLYSELAEEPVVLSIQGFDVQSATRQNGYVVVAELEGYRFTQQSAPSQYVQRVDIAGLLSLGDLRALLGGGNIATAYRFVKQPFQLALNLEKIKPYFTANPRLVLKLSANEAELDYQIQFEVFRGIVRDIDIDWPSFSEEQWTVDLPESETLFERIDLGAEETGGVLRFRLVGDSGSPQTASSRQFELHLHATRPLDAKGQPAEFHLPRVVASRKTPPLLVVANADNIESELKTIGGTVARTLEQELEGTVEIPPAYRDLRRRIYEIESEEQSFAVQLTEHEQRITASTQLVASISEKQVDTVQRIVYGIEYARLSQIRLLVPKSSRTQGIFFTTANGVSIVPTWSEFADSQYVQARFLLTEPRIGRFEFDARTSVVLPEAIRSFEKTSLEIPLVQTMDAEGFANCAVEVSSDSLLSNVISIRNPSWTPQRTLEKAARWVTQENAAAVPLEIDPIADDSAAGFIVSRELIRTAIGTDGQIHTRLQYRIHGTPRALRFSTPEKPEIQGIRAWWDADELAIVQVSPSGDGPTEQLVEIPESPELNDHVLTLDFRTSNPSPLSFSDGFRLNVPQLVPNVWVRETLWKVCLPRDQYLFDFGKNFLPRFFWERGLVFWSREPEPAYANASEWFNYSGGPIDRAEFDDGHCYRFSVFGPPGTLQIRTMSGRAVLLTGAAIVLALGAILFQFPFTRHVLTFFTIVFAVALAGVWYPVPTQLLLQPAAVGILALLAGMFIQHFAGRNEAAAPVITLSSPSDFGTSAPSSVEHLPAFVGAEDLTAPRVAALAKSASGSGVLREDSAAGTGT